VLNGNYLNWTNLSGVYQAGTLLTKYSANNSWGNALAVSVDSSLGDCSADFVVSPGSSYNMAGLTANNTISGYGDVSFAWHNANNTLYIYESGTSRGCFGPTVPGDVLRVERLGSTINYYQNGNLRYTSSVSSSGTLRAATTIYWIATQLGPASFYQPHSPAVTIVPSLHGDSTLYNVRGPPAAPITSSSPDAFAQPSLASSANFRSETSRTGAIPSADALLSYLRIRCRALCFRCPVRSSTRPTRSRSFHLGGRHLTITFQRQQVHRPGRRQLHFQPAGRRHLRGHPLRAGLQHPLRFDQPLVRRQRFGDHAQRDLWRHTVLRQRVGHLPAQHLLHLRRAGDAEPPLHQPHRVG
jgi:hypothetical protein